MCRKCLVFGRFRYSREERRGSTLAMSAFPRAGNTGNGWSPAPPSVCGHRRRGLRRSANQNLHCPEIPETAGAGFQSSRFCCSYPVMRKKEEKPVIQLEFFLSLSGKPSPAPAAVMSDVNPQPWGSDAPGRNCAPYLLFRSEAGT